jgi:GNAT superfamily N-acetyltransferase
MTQINSDGTSANWRAATAADLASIDRIGNAIHVDLQERPEVFAEKFRLFPEGCFILAANGDILGYGISHPWLLRSIPPLDEFLGSLPSAPECLFVHDVVVLPEGRGSGASGRLIEALAAVARQRSISFLALVSVYSTHPLWERYGFAVEPDPALRDKLKSYGDTARYMIRRLD